MDIIAIVLSLFGAGMSILALIVSYRQFGMLRLQTKSEIASKYFARFNIDPCIRRMTQFLESNKGYKIDGKINNPDCHDATVFLRYFEELELLIRSKSINENIVYNLFFFYIDAFDKQRHKWKEINYNSNRWIVFRDFYNRMYQVNKDKKTYKID